MWKFACFSTKANPRLDEVESWNLSDLEGPLKPKGKFRNPESFAPVCPKRGMESYFVYLSREGKLDEVESWNFADL
jgi:hypothetical protein